MPPKRPHDGAGHPRQMTDGLDVLESTRMEGAGNCEFQFLAGDLAEEAACEPRRHLRDGHDLQTVVTGPRSGRAAGGESQPALDDHGPSNRRLRHLHLPQKNSINNEALGSTGPAPSILHPGTTCDVTWNIRVTGMAFLPRQKPND